jgi:hypothetical protein
VLAQDLWVGAPVSQLHAGSGVVESTSLALRPQRMYNLTVAQAHTFFVGQGQWLVHNACFQGGKFSELPTSSKTPRHHMPSNASSPLPKNDGPAIQMDLSDHKSTSSWGSSQAAQDYRDGIASMLSNNNWRDAMAIEIRDVRRVASQAGDITKYNQAIRQMLDYARKLGVLAK